MSNNDEMRELVKRISGRDSVISVLRIYVDICGDLQTAAVLSQCVFWSDKGSHIEGWFYKSDREWHDEIGIKRGALEGAVKRLSEMYIVETTVMSARNNSPTTFYRVNMDNLTQVVISHLKIRFAEIDKSNTRSVEINKSDLLKSASPSVENSKSSYSRLQHLISTDDSQEKEKPKTQSGKPQRIEPDASITQKLPGHTMTPAEVWQTALGELSLEMTRATFDTWVKPACLLSVNGTWLIGAPNAYAKEWLDKRLMSTVKRVITGIVGESVTVEFVEVKRS